MVLNRELMRMNIDAVRESLQRWDKSLSGENTAKELHQAADDLRDASFILGNVASQMTDWHDRDNTIETV